MEWRPLRGFKGYEVNIQGQMKNIKTGRILSQSITNSGYYGTGIKGRRVLIHRALAEAYLTNPNNLPVINHIDGDRLNNSLSNLEWTTQKDNLEHAYAQGKGNRIFSDEEVMKMRMLHRQGNISHKELAKMFGGKRQSIGRAIRGNSYRHINININIKG